MVSFPIDSPSNISIQQSFPISRESASLDKISASYCDSFKCAESILHSGCIPRHEKKSLPYSQLPPQKKNHPSSQYLHTFTHYFGFSCCRWTLTMAQEIRTMRWSLLSILCVSNFEMVTILHSYDKSFSRKGLLAMMLSMMLSTMMIMTIKKIIMIILLTMVKTIIYKH